MHNQQATRLLFALPINTGIWLGVGYIYGKLTHVSPTQCAKILAISQVVDSIFRLLFLLVEKPSLEIEVSYTYTNLIVNTMTVIAMNHLNLIATKATIAFTGLTILTFLSKAVKSHVAIE